MGKRLHAKFFLEELDAGHEVEGCNYLLALEMEMNPVPGLRARQLGERLRRFRHAAGSRHAAPRPVARGDRARALRRRRPRRDAGRAVAAAAAEGAGREGATAMGYDAKFGSELEFFLFRESYEEARAKHYHDLTPSVPYILDYHILASGYDEPFLREVRNAMSAAGMRVESSKGEAWPGQHEINFRYADALKAADDHVIYKTGLKAMAYQHGLSVTFMAKPDHELGRLVVSHPLEPLAGRQGRVRRRVRRLQALPRRADRVRRGAGDLRRADGQLVQAVRRRELGADDAGLGVRQPHVRLPHRRARLVAARGDADPRRRRESVSRVLRADRLGAVRDRERARARARVRGQRVRVRRRPVPARAALRDRTSSSRGRWRGRRSATRSSTTTSSYARTEQRLFDEVVTGYERERFFERG